LNRLIRKGSLVSCAGHCSF